MVTFFKTRFYLKFCRDNLSKICIVEQNVLKRGAAQKSLKNKNGHGFSVDQDNSYKETQNQNEEFQKLGSNLRLNLLLLESTLQGNDKIAFCSIVKWIQV